MTSEEQDSDDGEYLCIENAHPRDMAQYRVIYSHTKNTKELEFCENENNIKKRCSAGRLGYNPGRLKRIVSCKRKTHHLTVSRRKQPSTGRTFDVASKKNEIACVQDMEEIFSMDPWECPPTDATETEERVSKDSDNFTELSKDHIRMMEVLFGRNLRLTVALTLWQRNVGELLTYFLRIQDSGVFVDFLPMIIKSVNEFVNSHVDALSRLDSEPRGAENNCQKTCITSLNDESPRVSIGCCVDLFPLVKKVLTNPYEDYLVVGLQWIQSVLKHWWPELSASKQSDTLCTDGNVQVFKQQLKEFWNQEPYLISVPGNAGEIAKVIESCLLKLP